MNATVLLRVLDCKGFDWICMAALLLSHALTFDDDHDTMILRYRNRLRLGWLYRS